MAANFEVKFIVDRVSANYKVQITDTSTGFSLVKANTKITFPDGYVVENTDVSNPDISSAGGNIQKTLRLDVNNKPITGDYTINFTGYDASDNEYTSQKQFNFTWSEPSIVIQDLSDSGVPVVKFKDITVWDEGNFTETATTREFSVDYPSTSAVDGTTKTSSETNLSNVLEIDMVDDLQYYEGVYDVSLNADILYSHTNGYLTVQYKRNSTQEFPVKRTPSQTDLLDKISQYKANIDEYKTTNPSLYKKYAEDYDNVLALYSHAVSRYKLGVGDGAQDSVEELLELIDDQTPHVYLSTPLTSFSIDENDFGAVAQVVKLKSEIGTFDSDGNLETIAKAFADELFEVEATDFKAEASKLSTLLAQFGTYDPATDTFSFLATADYFEQVKTYADDDKASAVALDILFSQFGTYDPATETFTFSSTADYFNEVKTYADNDKASAQKLTTLTSQFGSYDPNTNTFTFDNTADYFEEVKTYADENSAAASKVSSIGSSFGSFDGNTFNFSEAKITQELNTYTGLDFSNSQYFIDIEADIESKPIVLRQDAEPAVTYAPGSLWYDTNDDNKVYVLVDGDPKVWTLTDDSRIGATATHLTTLTSAFGSYDAETGFTIDTTANYFAEVKSYADTDSAAATKIENLGAELVTFDSDGNVTGVVLSSSFKSAVDSFVSDENNSALASKVEGIRVDLEGTDGNGGLTASVSSNSSAIVAKPDVFRQDDAPAVTEAAGSLWFDTNDDNKAYVLVAGTPNVWTETRDQGLISDISDKPFIFRQDDAPATTNPVGSLWYDTNDENKLYVLTSGSPNNTWELTQDGDIATAQATADGRPKVFRQDDAPATSEPEFSIWYDTNDNNLSYVLLGDGGDPETFTWTETIDGRVTDLIGFAESKYSLTADANGVVTGLELYSASGPNTTVSTFKITADKFIVRESSTDFVPFTLDGSQLKLDVPLNGVSGSFSGSLSAATGTFSGNVDGNIDGTSASTVKSNAADGATAKGITDDLTSVVAITSSDIAIVLENETKTFNDDGTPFYVDNAGQFSLGDKLSYDPTTNTLSITGAVTIESVSGLDKTDVGLDNVDNTSVANILDGTAGDFSGDVTGTVDGTAASTVKTGAADGASAKAETDKLTSVVSLTSSDIAIVNTNQTKTYNDAGTPFYVDNTGQFSLGNKLSFDGSNLSVSGTITMSASSTIDGATASTVKSGAADGANAKDTTDNLESVITITNTKIYQGTGTFENANTGFYLDDAGQFSLKDKLSFDGTTLSVDGEVTATSGSIGGVNLASNKLYVGTGAYNNSNTAFYLDDAGQFSLKDKLSWDGTSLTIDGEITSTSGNIGGWEINSTEIKSPAVSNVNRLEFSPTDGFIVNDDDNNTALLVNYGGLSSLSSTTTGVTFADVSNAEVASWDETVQAGNTLIKIPASSERYIYSSNYLTASFENDPHGGSYSYEISVDSITGAVATLTGTSTYLKATLALHIQIATDTSFNNVIKDVELYRTDVTGATTITFPGVSNKAVSFSISDSVTDVYLRFYWYRMYAVAYNDSITWSPKTFNVSSADANDDLVFLTYNGTTELTNEGVQIINDPTTFFKVDRANFTSGNPYVDIGGDVKVDGDLEVTGSINIVGDIENSDVSVSNLAERLGEINTDITVGASSSVDVTFPGNVTFEGTVTGGDVTVSNLETRLGEIDSNINIGHSAGVTITMRENLVVTGDLTVQGNTTTENSTQLHISDSLIHLADGNENSDSIDIGFVGHYSPDSGTTKQHAGIFRDADNGEWYIFDEYVDASLDSESNPTNVIDRTDSTFSLGVVNVDSLKTTSSSTIAGFTSTGNLELDDNVRLDIGTGNDLRFKHDGTNSTITNYTGNLELVNNADNYSIVFKTDNGSGGTTNYLVINGSTETSRFFKPIDLISTQLKVNGTTVIDSSRNLSAVQGDFTSNVNITKNNVGIATVYGSFKIESNDAQIDLVSSSAGTWGSAINLVEGASTTANTNVWSIARQTSGVGNLLRFNFGTGNQHDNAAMFSISSGGNVTATGSVTGDSIIKSGGTSSQFLKADGSVDSNAYALSSHNHDDRYYTETESDARYGRKVFGTNWGNTPEARYIKIEVPFIGGSGGSEMYFFDVYGYRDYGVLDSQLHYRVYLHARSNGTTSNSFNMDVKGVNVAANEEFKFAYKVVASSATEVYINVLEDYSGIQINSIPLDQGILNNIDDLTISSSDTGPTGTTSIIPSIYLSTTDSVNAQTLDSLDSSQFLRSDANDTASGNLTFNGTTSFTSTVTIDTGGSNDALVLRGTNPTINFLDDDTNADDFYIHVNSNNFYVLANRTNSDPERVGTGWETPHPLQLEADTNIGYLFGNRIFADNYHPNADKWTTARTVTFSGDITGNFSIDGSANVSNVNLQVANDSHTHDGRYYTETESDAKFAPVKRGSVTVTKDTYTRVARVEGNNLSSAIRMTVNGTTGSVVVNCLSDISVNHSADIIVYSQAGNYTTLDIRIISNNNEDFDIYLSYTGGASQGTSFTAAIEIFPLNNETITFSPTATVYSGTTFNHAATAGQIKWGQSGQSPNIYLGANKVFHEGNDGVGSNLNADMLDGLHASSFVRTDQSSTISGNLTATNMYVGGYIYHNGDTNTYIRFVGGDDFQIVSGGRQVLRMDEGTDPDKLELGDSATYTYTNGRIGVNTSTPTQDLHVVGSALFGESSDVTENAPVRIRNSADGFIGMVRTGVRTWAHRIGSNGHYYLRNVDGTYNVFEITDDNKVGIGKTPSVQLDVNGSIRTGGSLYVGTGGGFFYNDTGSRIRTNYDFYTNNSNTYLYATNLYLGAGSGDNVQVRGNRMYGNNWEIDTDGSAGFGTVSAGAQVHIVDNSFPQLRVNDDTGGGEAGMRLRSYNGTNGLHCDIFSKVGSSNETGYLGFRVPWNGYQKLRLHSNGSLSLGIPGNGQNNGGRYLSFEGNTDSSGEASGRLFFTEHNSTTTDMDDYGMSIGYRGGGTTVTTAGGNSWTGLSQISNGQWGMWGHDNSLAGSLIMYGDRAATYVDFAGNNIQGINNAYVANAIYHTGDTNTYLQFHGNDLFRVVIAGAEVTEWGNNYMKMRDNDTIRLGEGSDFRMWHDGTHTYFRNYNHAGGNMYWVGEDTEGTNHALLYMITNVSEPYVRLFANGSERLRTRSTGVQVYGRVEFNDTNTYIEKGDGNAVRLRSNYGYVNIGPQNSSWCHFTTDRGGNYFDKKVIVNSGTIGSYDEDLSLVRANGTADRILIRSTSIGFFLDSAEDMRLENDGDLHVEGDVIAYSSTISDVRLKDEVKTIDNALGKIKSLRGVEYIWNKGHREGQKDLGLIAQEVEQILPEIVREKKMPLMDDSDKVYKTVDYEKIVGVLIEAVKEQQEQIDELKARLDGGSN